MDRFKRAKILVSLISFILGYVTHLILNVSNREAETQRISEKDVFLVILIFSSVGNTNRRNAIRETWLVNYEKYEDVKYYFILSGADLTKEQQNLLRQESSLRNDLLVFNNIEDSFYSLTSKLLASFNWLTNLQEELVSYQHLSPNSFKYVLKCDDDSFVRVDKIVKELQSMSVSSKSNNLYWGFFDGRALVKQTGKYKEKEWVICDRYLPYALGGGYVVSKNLVQFVARNSKYWMKYKSEDVSLGAWLSSYNHINRYHDPRFDTEFISRGCHQSYLITHKHSEEALRMLHNNIKETGFLCKKEYHSRLSYIYNWTAIPSKCCQKTNANIP